MKFKQLIVVLILFLYSCSSGNIDSFSSPESSWIEGATYNTETQGLIIETEDQDYTFIGVPIEVWDGFKNASSKGEYYHQHIRDNYQAPGY